MRKTTLLLFTVTLLLSANVAKATVTIDLVQTTASSCANNGSMVVFAQTTTGTLLYSIVAGPVIFPVQTSNSFSSLPPGTYTVEVSNTANERQSTTVVITGNYQLPDFVPTVVNPHCPDSTSGSIVGALSPSSGLAPYLWELITPSPITRPQQLSDTFNNLFSGTYTIRLTDGCNNVQTKTVILFAAPVSMTYFGGGFSRVIGCDTTEIGISISTPAFRPPYKINYTINGISYTIDTAKVDDESVFNGFPNVYFTVPNMAYGGVIDNINISNGCGSSVSIPQVRICPFILNAYSFIPISTPGCQDGALTFFTIGDMSCNMSLFPKFPLTVTIRDIPANNVVEVKTYHSPFDYTLASTVMVPGSSYNVTMVDSCNRTSTTVVTPPPVNKYVSMSMNMQQALLDSTVILGLHAVGFPTQGTTLTITGGPATLHSTKPGYVYSENYIYPKTFTGQLSSDSSTAFFMANTAPGTYTYIITDSCGNQFPGTFEVTPDQVASFNYRIGYQPGCAGSSGLLYEVVHNTFTGVTVTDIASGNIIHTLAGWQMNSNPFTNVVNNILAADYEFKLIYYYTSGVENAMNNILIDTFVVRDTIHIIPYQNPALKTTAVSSCNGDVFLALTADSTKGIPPYQYEIVSGPQTFPAQSSNLFQLTQTGNYTIRLIDSCGNSVSVNVTVNPLEFPPLTSLGDACGNDSAVLTYGASPYFAYTWTKPDGSTYTGDTLFINPLTTADTGTYTIERTTTINGCTNIATANYRLSLGKKDSIAVSICTGQSFPFGSRILTQTGVYSDTIRTSSCDSISILNLTVSTERRDSSVVNICFGRTYPFGNRTLSQTGIYRDTIAGTPCDSISIVDLRVIPERKDSSVVSICTGQTYSFGNRVLSQTGIYRDTIPGLPCDSISILDLTVLPERKDSSVVRICTGQTYLFGNRVLNQAGIYRDTIVSSLCDSISVVNLIVTPQPKDSSNVTICQGQTYSFGSRLLNQPGIYRDTIAGTPCDSISILNLTVNNQRKDSTAATICAGQTYPFGNRLLSLAGIYRDTIAGVPCDSISVINLIVNDTPAIQVQSDKYLVTSSETIQLTAVPNNLATYIWNSLNQFSSNTIYNPTSIVNISSWYKVTVTGQNSCSNSDSLYVEIRPDTLFACDNRTVIFIPSAFSPNGNGRNEVFRIGAFTPVTYTKYHLAIYDRWGNLVFETSNGSQHWDGMYKGKPSLPGNYVYLLNFTCGNRNVVRKGNVLLLR